MKDNGAFPPGGNVIRHANHSLSRIVDQLRRQVREVSERRGKMSPVTLPECMPCG